MLFAKIGKSLKTKDKSLKFFLQFLLTLDFYLWTDLDNPETQKAPPISRRSYCMHSKNNLYYFFAKNSCT